MYINKKISAGVHDYEVYLNNEFFNYVEDYFFKFITPFDASLFIANGFSINVTKNKNAFHFINDVKSKIKEKLFLSNPHGYYYFYNENFFVYILIGGFTSGYTTNGSVRIVCKKECYEEIVSIFKEWMVDETKQQIYWYYQTQDGLCHKQFNLNNENKFIPEAYPFIGDVDKLIHDFAASTSAVMILLGPPGTGKSSLIKHLLTTLKEDCSVTYDENVMMSDEFYVTFLDSNTRYMVLEDSDLLLTSREKDDNRVMRKILNASDGMISSQNYKFIFTANVLNVSMIDDALIRPGRCFKVINFRHLKPDEALKVAQKAEIGLTKEQKEYTLAEIFCGEQQKFEKVGFI